jgi:hypothetical protein
VSDLSKTCVALLGMVGLQVKDVELRFKGSCYELVHGDVLTVKLYAANTIGDIGVPAKAVCPQIKELDITVVVASSDASLLLVV